MKTTEQIARALLERVAKNGAYTEDDLKYIVSREDIGYGMCQKDVKEILGLDTDIY